jgi:uncharacterized protein (UPF0332 family)
MISAEIQILINRADESHQAAKMLLDKGFFNFSAAQSYYTMFYLLGRGIVAFKRIGVFEPFCRNGGIWKRVCKNQVAQS